MCVCEREMGREKEKKYEKGLKESVAATSIIFFLYYDAMTSVRRILTRKLKSRFTTKVVNSAAVGQK
jgi:SUMO ligase MMS21 Smc5/6 complex component